MEWGLKVRGEGEGKGEGEIMGCGWIGLVMFLNSWWRWRCGEPYEI